MATTLKHTEFIGEARAASPALRLLLCAVAAALAACLMLPSVASAEVRRADVIKGETVEARGLTVAQCPSIDALYACVMDEDGTVYFERDATSPTQIASVTKIMTGVVALDAVDENQRIAVLPRSHAADEDGRRIVARLTGALAADDTGH